MIVKAKELKIGDIIHDYDEGNLEVVSLWATPEGKLLRIDGVWITGLFVGIGRWFCAGAEANFDITREETA